MKYFLILTLLAFSFLDVEGQTKGYIVKGDTAFSLGKIKFDSQTPNKVKFIINNQINILNADEITEFGYADSSKYVSKMIYFERKNQHLFLKILKEGELNLLELQAKKNRFFLESDSLIELKAENYLDILHKSTFKCAKWDSSLTVIRLKRRSLSYFVKQYNDNNCIQLRATSYGISVGIAASSILLTEKLYKSRLKGDHQINSSNFNFGVFTELPIRTTKNVSLLNEFRYSRIAFQDGYSVNSVTNHDIQLKMSNLQLNILPKYKIKLKRLEPYFFVGGSISYSFDVTDKLLEANIVDNSVYLDYYTQVIEMKKLLYGYKSGIGFSFFYRRNFYLGVEMSHESLTNNGATLSSNLLSLKANL